MCLKKRSPTSDIAQTWPGSIYIGRTHLFKESASGDVTLGPIVWIHSQTSAAKCPDSEPILPNLCDEELIYQSSFLFHSHGLRNNPLQPKLVGNFLFYH